MNFVERELRTRMGQHVLTLLFIIYLILGFKTPAPIASVIDNIFGKTVRNFKPAMQPALNLQTKKTAVD